MVFIRSSLLIYRILVGVLGVVQRGHLEYPTIFTFRRLVVFPVPIEAAAILLSTIYLFL